MGKWWCCQRGSSPSPTACEAMTAIAMSCQGQYLWFVIILYYTDVKTQLSLCYSTRLDQICACAGPESTREVLDVCGAMSTRRGSISIMLWRDFYRIYLVISSSRQGSDDREAPRAGGTERDWHLLCIAKQRTAFLSHLVNVNSSARASHSVYLQLQCV